jgi:hypothetical protein
MGSRIGWCAPMDPLPDVLEILDEYGYGDFEPARV